MVAWSQSGHIVRHRWESFFARPKCGNECYQRAKQLAIRSREGLMLPGVSKLTLQGGLPRMSRLPDRGKFKSVGRRLGP